MQIAIPSHSSLHSESEKTLKRVSDSEGPERKITQLKKPINELVKRDRICYTHPKELLVSVCT